MSAHFSRHHINIEENLHTISKFGIVCQNIWHHLTVHIIPNLITIKLDGKKIQLNKTNFSISLINDIRSLPVNIGGATGKKENFFLTIFINNII